MDDKVNVEVTLRNENIWMNQEQIGKLFNKSKSTINEHIKNIYAEGELSQKVTMRKFGNSEFSTKPTNFYNLDIIIAVGYRVKTNRGTQFRIWANKILKDYLVKGYNLNVDRFKNNDNDILMSKGTVSHKQALEKAHAEYDKYMQRHLKKAEKDYLEIMNIEVRELDK